MTVKGRRATVPILIALTVTVHLAWWPCILKPRRSAVVVCMFHGLQTRCLRDLVLLRWLLRRHLFPLQPSAIKGSVWSKWRAESRWLPVTLELTSSLKKKTFNIWIKWLSYCNQPIVQSCASCLLCLMQTSLNNWISWNETSHLITSLRSTWQHL